MKIARVVDQDNREALCVFADNHLLRIEGDLAGGQMSVTDKTVEPTAFLPPVSPRVIYCIGVNYAEHAREGGHEMPGYPVVFMKNVSAATGHHQPICLPGVCEDEIDYEGELAVIVGQSCKNVTKDEALNYILGYTIANDVTARVWQKEKGGSQWCRGKGFDTFCPLGPWMVTPDEVNNPNNLSIRTTLNGEVVQNDTTANMVFNVAALISFLSEDTTLLPGTVILTGTPQGIGWARNPRRTLQSGDTVTVEISQIGALINPVI